MLKVAENGYLTNFPNSVLLMRKILSSVICALAQQTSKKLLSSELLRKMSSDFGISLEAVFLSGVQSEFFLCQFSLVPM